MKFLLTLLLIFISCISYSQNITPEQAKDSIDKQATVCGTVTGVHATDKITLLNMGGKYPNNAFTVAVFSDSAAKFSYQLSTLEGKDICVSGLIKDYKGKPEVMVSNEKQISIKPTLTQTQRE